MHCTQIARARKAAAERNQFLDSKRKKFKEDLEARERRAQEEREKGPVVPDLTQAEKLEVNKGVSDNYYTNESQTLSKLK